MGGALARSSSGASSGSRRLDGDAVFGGDGRELSKFRHALGGGRIQSGKHLVEAATRRTQDQDTGRLVADIAEGMTPAAGAEEEAARRDAVGRKLAPSRLVLCAAPAYLKERGMPREPSDLAKHNCICTSLLPWGDEWRLAGKRGEQRVAVGGSIRSNDAEMLRAAALDGIGIAVLPTWAVTEPLRTGALRRVLDAWEPPTSTIYAVYPGNRLIDEGPCLRRPPCAMHRTQAVLG
jgi:DNA-binding transcriptional LysR family regulator